MFAPAIPLSFKDDIEKQVYYVSEDIDEFDLIVGASGIDGIRVTPRRRDVDLARLSGSLRDLADRCRTWPPRVAPERVWTRQAIDAQFATFEQMRARGLVFQPSAGLLAVDERVARLMQYLDAAITSRVKHVFGAREYLYPTLMPSAVLRRGGYLRSFPHLLMFVARLHCDFDVYAAASQMPDDLNTRSLLRHCEDTELCLPPTMCYHTYAQLASSRVPAEGLVVTAKGKSFRFESRYEQNAERLWDFTIREVVFIGAPALVSIQRKRMMEEVCALAARWDLTGICETASDPFFAEDDGKNNSFAQRLMALKYELRLDVAAGRTIAVASFNRHNDFIGNAYEIGYGNQPLAHTACAGVGLERLAFAFLCQHGVDEARWPAEVRQGLAKLRATEAEAADTLR
jgi:seryl-tRNA synthetase